MRRENQDRLTDTLFPAESSEYTLPSKIRFEIFILFYHFQKLTGCLTRQSQFFQNSALNWRTACPIILFSSSTWRMASSGLSSQGSSHQAVRTYCSVAEWFQQWGKVQEICLLVENKWYYVSASCFAFMEESHLSSCFSVQWTVRGWVYMNAFRVLYSPAYIPLLFLFFCHEKSMQITGKKKKWTAC